MSDDDGRLYECKKCHAPVPPRVWARQKKMCETCYKKYRELNEIDKRIAGPAMLSFIPFTYGHVFLQQYIHDPSIGVAAGAIVCYAVAAIVFPFVIKGMRRQRVEKPDIYAAQRPFRFACMLFPIIATAIFALIMAL